MKRFRVIRSRKTEYENPISVKRGEEVLCIEDSDPNGDWAGWTYCKTDDNEGWIPYQIIERNESTGHMLEDYCSVEFDLYEGEELIMETELNGWIWCYKSEDSATRAWAPLNCIEEIE